MPAGVAYTYVGNTDSRNGATEITTAAGIVILGGWGYFLPAEHAAAIGQGFILVAGMSGPPYVTSPPGATEVVAGVSTFNSRSGPVLLQKSDVLGTGLALSDLDSEDETPTGLYNVNDYGAVGNGTTDDYAAIMETYGEAQATNGALYFPNSGYAVSESLIFATPVSVIGPGMAAAQIKAIDEMAEVISYMPGGAGGVIRDITVNANGLAANAIRQSITTETSVPTTYERVQGMGATGYQFVNVGCEDVTYANCFAPGNETYPNAVASAIQIVIPNGAARIIGGQFFGKCDLTYQLLSVSDGAVIGPMVIENSGSLSDTILALSNCYIYDGDPSGDACIDTYTSLTNIIANGCYFVAQVNRHWINGNIPAGAHIQLNNCQYIWGPGTSGENYVLQASGAGSANINGYGLSVGEATFNLFNPVAEATTAITYTDPEGSLAVGGHLTTANSIIDDGSGNMQMGGSIQSGAAGVRLTNSGAIEFLNSNGAGILSGSGPPSNELGSNGFYYLQNDSPGIYFKTGGAWELYAGLSANAPVNTVAPEISGTVAVGDTLLCTTGEWTGSPTSYAYQWQRDGTAITSGTGYATGAYVVQSADLPDSITCVVTATNNDGSATAPSNSLVAASNLIPTIVATSSGPQLQLNGERLVLNGWNTWLFSDHINTPNAPDAPDLLANFALYCRTAAATGANALRVELLSVDAIGGTAYTGMTLAAYGAAAAGLLATAQENGIDYIIYCDWNPLAATGSGTGAAGPNIAGANWTNANGAAAYAEPMWNSILTGFGGTWPPGCIIEPVNEPNGITDAQWLASCQTFSAYIRGTGYKGPLIWDGPNYADEVPTTIATLWASDAANQGVYTPNCMLSQHVYYTTVNTAWGGPSQWPVLDQTTYASIVTEAGNANAVDGTTVINAAFSAAMAPALGALPNTMPTYNGTLFFNGCQGVDNSILTSPMPSSAPTFTSPWGTDVQDAFAGTTTTADAAMSTLVDDFVGSSLSSQWVSAGDVTVSGGQAVCALNTSYTGSFGSADPLNLTNSHVFVEFTAPASITNDSEAFFQLNPSNAGGVNDSMLSWNWYEGELIAAWYNGSGTAETVYSESLAASATIWLQILETSGTVYWQTSADGITWTTVASIANPVAVTSLYVELGAGCTVAETANAYFGSLNVTPTAGSSAPEPNGPTGTWNNILNEEWAGTTLNANWADHVNWTNQNGVTDLESNVSVNNGTLTLTLSSATDGAAIQTVNPIVESGYYTEVKANFAPFGWNAAWLCTTDAEPSDEYEEIDFMETLGNQGTCTTHSANGTESASYAVPGSWFGAMHTYGVLWQEGTATYFWDGVQVHQETLTYSGEPMYVILTVGQGESNTVGTGVALTVDYVRVWSPA